MSGRQEIMRQLWEFMDPAEQGVRNVDFHPVYGDSENRPNERKPKFTPRQANPAPIAKTLNGPTAWMDVQNGVNAPVHGDRRQQAAGALLIEAAGTLPAAPTETDPWANTNFSHKAPSAGVKVAA